MNNETYRFSGLSSYLKESISALVLLLLLLAVVGSRAESASITLPVFAQQYPVTLRWSEDQLAVGPDNALWLADSHDIIKMTLEGKFSRFAVSEGVGRYLVLGADHKMWFKCQSDEQVCNISATGQIRVLPGYSYLTGDFALASDGNLWSPAYGSRSIGKITPAGVTTYFLGPPRGTTLRVIAGMAGSVWFTDMYENKIGKVVTASGAVTQYNSPLINSDPDGLVLGPDNNIWISPDAYQDLIRVAPTGRAGAFADGYQTEFLVRGNGPYIYGVADTGIITQMNVETGRSSLNNPPANALPNMDVVSAVLGPDRNLWLVANGSPTSVIQRVRIPGGAP